VQQVGTPHEIYHAPVNRFVASFIGETNLWEGTVVGTGEEEVRVRLSSGQMLTGLKRNASPRAKLSAGGNVVMSIRPESVQESTDAEGDNILCGVVELAEFTGASVHYVTRVGGEQLRTMSINLGRPIKPRGARIRWHIPRESIYFAE
jgi:iron(III) transport system ATP-binding protein